MIIMMTKKALLLLAGTLIIFMMCNVSYAVDKKNNYYRKPHNQEYRQALKILWTKVYPANGSTLYCNQSFSTRNYKERKQQINAEHVFPMSWVAKDLRCGKRKKCQKSNARFRQIESDLHNIYPARIKVNQARSSYRFGEVAGELRQFGSCDFEVNRKKRIAEPMVSSRGKIARSMRYMHYQYGLTLYEKTEKLMKKWDKKYPPTQEEVRRAMVIQREQGRENPFVTRYPFQK